MEYEGSRCSRCGTFPDEWLDEHGYPIEPPPYVATSIKCLGCVELDGEQDLAGPGRQTRGMYFFLVHSLERR